MLLYLNFFWDILTKIEEYYDSLNIYHVIIVLKKIDYYL